MKKIIAVIISFTIICSALSARNFFSGRFLEVKAGTGVGVSNNLFTASDLLVKDLVIDLTKLADNCPDDGMNFVVNADPTVEINLNIAKFHLGCSVGSEMYGKFDISKDLFNFVGKGNQVGETLNLNFTADSEVFAYTQVDVGFDAKKFKLHVKPAVFVPVLATRGSGGTVTFTNGVDGSINVAVNVNMDVYSPVDLQNPQASVSDINQLTNGYGFDLGAYLALPLSRSLSLDFDVRIPLAPGHIYTKASYEGGYSYNVDFSNSKDAKSEMTEPKFSGFEDTDFEIHRPLKASVYLDKNLLGTLFNARVGGGFGIQRPFSEEQIFYPEYYLGCTLSLFDFIKVVASSKYQDRVFVHELGTTLSIRFIQVDLGVNTQSASFKRSMEVAGLGAYAYVTVGI